MKTVIKTGYFVFALVSIITIGSADLYACRWDYWGSNYRNGNINETYLGNLDYMEEELGLSKKQVKQIFEIGRKYREVYYKIRGDYNKIQTMRMEQKQDIEKILNETQRRIFNRYSRSAYNRYGWYGGCPW
jgi:site-specific DNA-adenine methylase